MTPNPSKPLPLPRSAASLLMQNHAYAQRAGKWQFLWLCFLILSFCYELPLTDVTTYFRANPRLFDIASILGFFFVLPGLRRTEPLPRLFRWWAAIVVWFVFCAALWASVWLPWAAAGKFSVFYAIRYIQGLFVLYLVASIPLDARQKRLLHYMVVIGGIVVAIYAIPEHLRGGTVRQLTEEKELRYSAGELFSCLGPTYFHIAMFGALSCAMALSLVALPRAPIARWSIIFVAFFVAWPSLFCGARAGLLGVGLVILVGLIFIKPLRTRLTAIALGAGLMLGLGVLGEMTLEEVAGKSYGFQRLVGIEERGRGNVIAGRIMTGVDFITGKNADLYEWQGWRLPVFGGGFYAVPRLQADGELYYRRGYGIHNVYAFPLEQGGVVAFVLFFGFLIACFKDLRKMTKLPGSEDQAFALGAWVFFLALLIVAWGGQVFWRGFGTENFNAYILVLLVLATKRTNSHFGGSRFRCLVSRQA